MLLLTHCLFFLFLCTVSLSVPQLCTNIAPGLPDRLSLRLPMWMGSAGDARHFGTLSFCISRRSGSGGGSGELGSDLFGNPVLSTLGASQRWTGCFCHPCSPHATRLGVHSSKSARNQPSVYQVFYYEVNKSSVSVRRGISEIGWP